MAFRIKKPFRLMKKIVSDRVTCKFCGKYIEPFTKERVNMRIGTIEVYGCYSGYCKDCFDEHIDPVYGVATEERLPVLTEAIRSQARFKDAMNMEEWYWNSLVRDDVCKDEEWTRRDEKMQEALSAWEVREGIIGGNKNRR